MIILMGVAGAGKSMQGKLLADTYGYAWISTGEILRVLVTGKRRQEMLQGKLLSDEEMIRLFDKVLDLIDTSEEFVLDGFPRTITQAKWLVEQLQKGRFSMSAVVHLKVSEEVVHERLIQRGRQDDTEDAISARFKEYREVTLPIMHIFEEVGIKVHDIDASKGVEEIHNEIMNALPSV